MRTLTSVVIISGALLGFNAQATSLEQTTEQLVAEQIVNLNQQIQAQLNQDILFATNTVKMPLVSEHKTLVAKTAKKATDSE